jgi:fructokinase
VEATAGREPHAPLVCLGEALVDLICPDPVAEPADARRFTVHPGGALANVAVAVRRAGRSAALAGGCGDDEWGAYLRDALRREGVDLSMHTVTPGASTPFAFATLDEAHEPSFRIHGDGIDEAIATLAGREDEVVAGADAIVVGSNTLPGEGARAVTEAIAAAASRAGVPLLFDPNLRPNRWDDIEEARTLCLSLLERTTVLKCNLAEARWLTGGDGGAAELADELTRRGPRLVVVTAGTRPAVARGVAEAEVSPPPVEVVSPLGAGDCFMGTLAAGLAADGWRLDDVDGPMRDAARAGAEACGRLGAFGP